MRQLTNEARAEQTRLLCLAKRKKPIGQILNVNIPKSWQELPDKELRFVFRLLQGEYSLTQIKTLCLLRWGQLKIVRREGAVFIVRHHKKNYPLTTLQICEVCGLARANEAGFNGRAQANSNVVQSTEALAWLGDFPQYPVRLSRIGIYRPVRADFQNVSFGDFLALDNLYQGYLQTQREELLHDMALVMYQTKHIHLSKVEQINIFYWFTSLKRWFANMFSHFFKMEKPDENGSTMLSFKDLQQNMNTQIRALTGGDITKEKEVLQMDCWRALTELEAKAVDYEELSRKAK